MTKLGHHGWAIALAKWSVWPKLKMSQRCLKRSYDHIRVVVSKKVLKKTPYIGKMRGFKKWPKLATMHGL